MTPYPLRIPISWQNELMFDRHFQEKTGKTEDTVYIAQGLECLDFVSMMLSEGYIHVVPSLAT
jgi:hypothetical protein